MVGVQENFSGVVELKGMEEVAMTSSLRDTSWELWTTTLILVLLGVLLTSSSFFTYLSSLKSQIPREKLGPMKPVPEVIWSLPWVGEGLRMWWQGLHWFLHDRSLRFKEIYKMRVFGYPVVVVNTPDAAKFIMTSPSRHMFPENYPGVFLKVIFFNTTSREEQNEAKEYASRLIVEIFSGQNLNKYLPLMNRRASEAVESWIRKGQVNATDESLKYSSLLVMDFVWTETGEDELDAVTEEVVWIRKAFLSLPINLPGFTYHKAWKARKSFISRIEKCIRKRIAEGSPRRDLLSILMEDTTQNYSHYEMASLIVGVMFVGTTIKFLTPWVIKYLHDYPEVRESIQAENEEFQKKVMEDSSMKWFNLKSLPLTTQVFHEVHRLRSIVTLLPRHAAEDVKYQGMIWICLSSFTTLLWVCADPTRGYTIPKDSTVWISAAAIHTNPEIFPDPLAFNPSRFQTAPKTGTYLGFGIGPKSCPGQEMARIQTILLINHLVTKCRWERVGIDDSKEDYARKMEWDPKDGFPMSVRSRNP